jgi:hypothetical protein
MMRRCRAMRWKSGAKPQPDNNYQSERYNQ